MATCERCGSEISASDAGCAKCDQDLEKRMNNLIGKSLAGKYRLEEHLGSGGMCEVYRATHEVMGKQVAVKVLKPALAADPLIAQRFEQEARAASRIHHPHAINVMDYGIAEDSTPYIVMEFVRGITLGELLRKEGALTVERAANILRQVAGALVAAHAVEVVHRDIKPDNIIIAEYDGSDWVEVVDFGVAKVLKDVNRRTSLTGANIIVGTPRYMSPEQCEEKPVDARSDIYSLGIVLYEMLTGEAPFKGDSSTRLLVAHAQEPPEPLRNKRPDLSRELEAVVMSALEKDPSRRPQSAGEFASRFEDAAGLGQPVYSAATRAGAFSRISVSLGEEDKIATPVDVQAADENAADGEATLVRPRPARDLQSSSGDLVQQSNEARMPDPSRPPDEPQVVLAGRSDANSVASRYTASHAYRKQSNTAGVVALVVVLLAVAGVAAYIIFGMKSFGRSSAVGSVIDAQQAVTDAIARVDSLPKDHPLRSYLSDLRQWQGELKAYQEVRDDTPQVADKAERYKQRAEEITGQVRTAQASLGRESTNSSNSSAPHAQPPAVADSAAKAKEGEAEKDEAEPDVEGEPENKEAKEAEKPAPNKNESKPRKADPPVIDPVRPPSETEPKNANKSSRNSPPTIEKVNPIDE